MDRGINRNLILDLARLALRYTPKDFERLATWVRDPVFMAEMATILESMSTARKVSKPRKKDPPGAGPGRPFAALREQDPAKFEVVSDFDRRLRSGEFLKKAAHIRAFAQSIGLKVASNSSRRDLLPTIVDHISTLPLNEIRATLERSLPLERDYGDEYQKWASMILNPKQHREDH